MRINQATSPHAEGEPNLEGASKLHVAEVKRAHAFTDFMMAMDERRQDQVRAVEAAREQREKDAEERAKQAEARAKNAEERETKAEHRAHEGLERERRAKKRADEASAREVKADHREHTIKKATNWIAGASVVSALATIVSIVIAVCGRQGPTVVASAPSPQAPLASIGPVVSGASVTPSVQAAASSAPATSSAPDTTPSAAASSARTSSSWRPRTASSAAFR